jgi:aspartate carbamoyltransferase catalytic subunit
VALFFEKFFMAISETELETLSSELKPGCKPHHILRAQQFTREWLTEDLFPRAQQMQKILDLGDNKALNSLEGKRVKAIFYESSTRTLESFGAATELQGGSYFPIVNAGQFSSAVKGETSYDSTKIRGSYRDNCTIIRHNKSGGVAEAAAVSKIPVINAGDGDGQHPTQALTDAHTVYQELGQIGEQRITFVGDLLFGRTDHSFVYLLSKFPKMRFDFVSPSYLRMKPEILAYLDRHEIPYQEHNHLNDEVLSQSDGIYVTRDQIERFDFFTRTKIRIANSIAKFKGDDIDKRYRIDLEAMSKMQKHAIVLHPFPRKGEIPREVDADPRAAYFRQAENGLYVRMALLHMMLGQERKII